MRELRAEELRRRCDPGIFDFQTTAELEPLREVIGQERAIEALECGLGIKDPRYNIYVAGGPGTGKMSIIRSYLERVSAEEPRPPDLCYVHNFEDPYTPRYLPLQPGKGVRLKADMGKLIELLKRDIPTAFKSEEYQERKRSIDEAINRERDDLFSELERRAQELGFALQRTPIGINTIPLLEGKPMSEEQYKRLSQEERLALEERHRQVRLQIEEAIRRAGGLEEERARLIEELNREVAAFAVEPKSAALKEAYGEEPRVAEFLEQVKADILANLGLFLGEGGDSSEELKRYDVNVLVDNSKLEGAPVIVEDNATYPNLFGKVERRAQMGVLTTDFTMIRPGSLHRANGGYLVLNANNLFRNPLSWEALKVALKSGKITIEDPGTVLGWTATEGLRPEPIPLQVKLIIVGSHELYSLLQLFEEDFQEFFKIKSEFDSEMPWDERYIKKFGPFIRARVLERPGLRDFDRTGVARLVEYAAELTGDQNKLSARFSDIMAIIREASYRAERAGASFVTAEHVEQAIQERRYRSNLIEEKLQEMIARGELLVEVDGAKVGQVNGLAVYELGDFSFGRPTRITTNVFAGKDGVTNIEREAELSGKIHTKGLLILKGWLGEKFAQDKPLSLSASITFEQSYSEIDGDSASATEAIALLSALSGVPIKQSIAITGSVDQKGEVQPIGGVNEKIEGFFKTCKLKGLTGEQGVIIPEKNVANLMLSREVVEAVREGKFHIWAIKTIDEGVELLTGQKAGRRLKNGKFEKGSIYWRVERRLREIAKSLKAEEKEEK
ncbi:MAG: Lon protease family protein [Candidatus Bipolaricaulia bacterium]